MGAPITTAPSQPSRAASLVDDFIDIDIFLEKYLQELVPAADDNGIMQAQAHTQAAGPAQAQHGAPGPSSQVAPQPEAQHQMGYMPMNAAQMAFAGMGMPPQGMTPQMAAYNQQLFDFMAQQAGMAGMMGMQGFGYKQPPIGYKQPPMQAPMQMQAGAYQPPAGAQAQQAVQQTTAVMGGLLQSGSKENLTGVKSEHDEHDDSTAPTVAGRPRKKAHTSSTGAEVVNDAAERKRLALQEKNRRGQRRFRERQKAKLTEMQEQIAALTQHMSALQNENAALQTRTSILEKVLDMKKEQIQLMRATDEDEDEIKQTDIQSMGSHVARLTPQMIKEMGSEQIYRIYQTYVKDLGMKLAMAERKGGDAAANATCADDVLSLVKDVTMLIIRLIVVKPVETRKCILGSWQHLGGTAVNEVLRSVIADVGLCKEQQAQAVELRSMFLAKIKPIMEERRALNIEMKALLPHCLNGTLISADVKVHETANKLRDNLRVEQHVIADFANALYHGVFKPYQMAAVLVKCYPAVPFVLGVATAVAAEYGAATGEDMGLTEELVSGPNVQAPDQDQGQHVLNEVMEPKVEPEALEAARAVDLILHAAQQSPQPAYSPPLPAAMSPQPTS